MKEFKIIPYNPLYRNKLYAYLKRISDNKDDNYLQYCIDKSDGEIPSVLVVNGIDEIVGCHLFFNTSLMAKGEEKKVAWGHETYLDTDYRSAAGLDFVLSISDDNSLGIGLTEINKKIITKMKRSVFMETVFNYFLLNIFFPIGVLKKLFKAGLKPLKAPQNITAGVIFKLVKEVDDVVIPGNGYWHKNVDYDLIRDKEYINDRFLDNKVFNYTVYEYHNNNEESCYFVIRPILYRGVPTILLVDYRYYGNEELMRSILSAVKKLAIKNYIGVIQTTSGIKVVEDVFNSKLCIKRLAQVTIPKSLNPSASDYISITPADSDVDFNR